MNTEHQEKSSHPKLGMIAGRGNIPLLVVDACLKQGRGLHVVALEGNVDDVLISKLISSKFSFQIIRIGKAGAILKSLKQAEAKEIVMIGGIRRPSLKELCPDLKAASIFAKLGLKSIGDDGALKTIVGELEKEGFAVVGVDSIVSELLAPEGILTKTKPDKIAEEDISHGFEKSKEIGRLDIGQSVVIQQGIILGVEAVEGTDNLIKRCGDIKREGVGGVLVKTKKPQQERRVDLPTIGVSTVENANKSGLRGIAVEAGQVLVVDLEKVVAKADELGMFVVGINSE